MHSKTNAHPPSAAVEDMWHIYNLVRAGDSLTAKTFRKVTSISATGQGSSVRVTIKLTINVEATDFDPVGESIYFELWTLKLPLPMLHSLALLAVPCL